MRIFITFPRLFSSAMWERVEQITQKNTVRKFKVSAGLLRISLSFELNPWAPQTKGCVYLWQWTPLSTPRTKRSRIQMSQWALHPHRRKDTWVVWHPGSNGQPDSQSGLEAPWLNLLFWMMRLLRECEVVITCSWSSLKNDRSHVSRLSSFHREDSGPRGRSGCCRGWYVSSWRLLLRPRVLGPAPKLVKLLVEGSSRDTACVAFVKLWVDFSFWKETWLFQ